MKNWEPTAKGGSEMIDLAARFARRYHSGQSDQGGQPYYEVHVVDVWSRLANELPEVQVVALLHDILEDTTCTEATLRIHFPTVVVDAVVAITKLDRESLESYYARVRANPIALMVKLCGDIPSNTNPARNALLQPHVRRRLEAKYQRAVELLTE